MEELLKQFNLELEGEIIFDEATRIIYATDASSYREKPMAVAYPRSVSDIRKLVHFAGINKIALIPRAAGTSLAGQVVGNGIVVDISVYMNNILVLNREEKWIKVEPGVIRDELNQFLFSYGLFFGPETSTSNRATVGGMVGNNASGSNSIAVGATRDHLLEADVVLADGTEVTFKDINIDDLQLKKRGGTLESRIYAKLDEILSNEENQNSIRREYPQKAVQRRNTGYALDAMLDCSPYTPAGPAFNICKILAGAEGTLAFITAVKLKLLPLPPSCNAVLCAHFNSLQEALEANLLAAGFKPFACELIDSYILECTKDNIEQSKNRFFVEGDPEAILVVEIVGDVAEMVTQRLLLLTEAFRKAKLGFHYPIVYGEDIKKVWSLRKAGLGVLSNTPGDAKPVTVIEDTAVAVNDLSEYVSEFDAILKRYGLSTVHYAHAGAGELHMRPILNLKTEEGQRLFKTVATEIALLVKKYKGSLSGEHGDGRLRSQFIPVILGKHNYELLRELKRTWDPLNVFNPGKIVDAVAMDEKLRYQAGSKDPAIKTYFRFDQQNVLQHAEQCNGSGDCRKSHLMGGTMCPSYMATKNEKDTTRARANILREFLTHSEKINRFDHKEIYEVMDLCLSCKGCKSECPSNVDMAKLKAEFLQQYYDVNGVPLRSRIISSFAFLNQMGSVAPSIFNYFIKHPLLSKAVKKFIRIAGERTLPALSPKTLSAQYKQFKREGALRGHKKTLKTVYLFCDEFTNFNDAELGMKTLKLLRALGYEVLIPSHIESGRASLSKGLLKKAKKIINHNIKILSPIISEDTPLIGIEPSAILSFRDEYPDLADESLLNDARSLARYSFTIEEFLDREIRNGNIKADVFTTAARKILLHGHCQQKAISDIKFTASILTLPQNYKVEVLRSGCCGMAGSFGFEEEHYNLSMKIGELVLFPAVRNAGPDVIIAAPGTSCRHQVHDGTGRKAYHPVEILYDAYFEANDKKPDNSNI